MRNHKKKSNNQNQRDKRAQKIARRVIDKIRDKTSINYTLDELNPPIEPIKVSSSQLNTEVRADKEIVLSNSKEDKGGWLRNSMLGKIWKKYSHHS